MKFAIHLSPNTEVVPTDYVHRLCSVFHYWMGKNELHGNLSLYSLSTLRGGFFESPGFQFPKGAIWEIGVYEPVIAERLIRGLLLKPPVLYGMKVRNVERLDEPEWPASKMRFLAGSPVMIRELNDEKQRKHLTFEDGDLADKALTRVLHRKIRAIGRDDWLDAKMYFDRDFRTPKTKLINIKGIQNRGSVCPVIVEGKPEAMAFAWSVGAGEMTGVGFGSLRYAPEPISREKGNPSNAIPFPQ